MPELEKLKERDRLREALSELVDAHTPPIGTGRDLLLWKRRMEVAMSEAKKVLTATDAE